MSEVKNVIGYFCKYINLLLDWNGEEMTLKPENLRLAKQNKCNIDLVKKFWLLLSKLEYPIIQYNCQITLIERVKLNFAYHKYKGVDFYSLPEDMSYGSRELLLSLTWLISNTDVLTKLVEQKLAKSSINYEFPEHDPLVESTNNNKLVTKTMNFNSEMDTINCISTLISKININLKIHDDCNRKTIENMEKIHYGTKYDIDIPHLSVSDVYYNKNPELEKEFVEKNKMVVNLLEAKTKWDDCQGIFWKWMLTVLNEKIIDKLPRSKKLESEVLMKFIELLKKQIHVKSQKTDGLVDGINENGANPEKVIPKQTSAVIQRHIYLMKKNSKSNTTISQPQTGPQFDVTVITQNDCSALLKYYNEVVKNETDLVTSRSVKQILDKLNSILNENNLTVR